MPSVAASVTSAGPTSIALVRGAVVWAAPDPVVGVEQSGRRPLVVVASAGYLEHITNLVLAVPVTTSRRGWPNHVRLEGETGLDAECFAMTEQVRAISRARISKVAGSVDRATLQQIDGWLRDFLDLR